MYILYTLTYCIKLLSCELIECAPELSLLINHHLSVKILTQKKHMLYNIKLYEAILMTFWPKFKKNIRS